MAMAEDMPTEPMITDATVLHDFLHDTINADGLEQGLTITWDLLAEMPKEDIEQLSAEVGRHMNDGEGHWFELGMLLKKRQSGDCLDRPEPELNIPAAYLTDPIVRFQTISDALSKELQSDQPNEERIVVLNEMLEEAHAKMVAAIKPSNGIPLPEVDVELMD